MYVGFGMSNPVGVVTASASAARMKAFRVSTYE
jgi:hypothetical protein